MVCELIGRERLPSGLQQELARDVVRYGDVKQHASEYSAARDRFLSGGFSDWVVKSREFDNGVASCVVRASEPLPHDTQ